MVFDCKVVRKMFTNDNGLSIRYYDFIVTIDGKEIHLSVKPNDKNLVNYLLDKEDF